MPNNYLQFSWMILGLTEKEHECFARLLAEAIGDDEDNNPLGGGSWDFLKEDGGVNLWIQAEESGDPGAFAEVFEAALQEAGSDRGIALTWAETCSKMRPDEFAGGGCFVTRAGVTYFNVQQLIEDAAHAWAVQLAQGQEKA